MNVPRGAGFFVSGGTMPLDSKSYVERSSDRALFEGLLAGQYCYVLNSRQMGKSSLSVRVLAKLGQAGVRTALVDLTRIGGRNVTASQWYAGLCVAIGSELDLESEMLDFFRQNAHLSPMQRFFGALENVALASIAAPISVFVDEIDSTKNLSFEADEFFAGIRECYNRRVQNPIFDRLSFCLIGVAVPTDLISNPSTTPFNIGERIPLNDFTLDEMQALAGPLGPNGEVLVDRVHYWTAGQPFLSQSLCEAIISDPLVQTAQEVDALVQSRLLERRARTTNINLSDVGDRALNAGASELNPERFRANLLATYERAWRGGLVPDDESNRVAVVLKLSGLMKSDGRRLEVRNRIYREVFNRKWIEDNMPERELLRERQAFRRGILRAASASAAVVVVVCALGLFAWKSENDALSAKRMLDYRLYVSDMNNMRLLEEIGDVGRMEAILDLTRNSPYRGFEWSFWLGRIHDSKEEYTLDYSAPGKREEGFISVDGKQVCLYDSLVGVVVGVDRQTRKPLFTRRIGRRARIVATRAGFVAVESKTSTVEVTDVATGSLRSSVDFGSRIILSPVTRSRSDFALVMVADNADGKARKVLLWDLVSGKTRYTYYSQQPLPDVPMWFNQAGTRLLIAEKPGPEVAPGSLRWSIRDTVRNVEFDRFILPPRAAVLDYSSSGNVVLYRDANRSTFCRSIDQHRVSFSREWDGGDIPATATITADDRALAEYFGTGLATLVDLTGSRVVNLGQHVWNLGLADTPNRLLAASTSVRILNEGESGATQIVGVGTRLGRDDAGGVNVFHERPLAISHYTDPDFRYLYRTDSPPNLRDGYPYNGRWRLCIDSTKTVGLFSDVDGKQPPVRISPIPANYSCGNSRESLVVVERGLHRVHGLSGTSGEVRWSVDVPDQPVSGLWVAPNGQTVLALAGDVDLLAIDVRTGKQLATLGGHNVRVSNVSFTRDGKGMFTCGVDGRVILWNLSTLRMIQEFRGNAAQRVSSADLSPDGSRVATCNFTGSWQLWDARTGVQLMDIHGSTLPLRSILFTGDGKSVVTAGDDLQVRRWGTLNQDPSVRIPIAPDILKDIKL